VVADLRPEILVLNEALFCRQFLARTVDYAGLFGFPYQDSCALRRCPGVTRFSAVSHHQVP